MSVLKKADQWLSNGIQGVSKVRGHLKKSILHPDFFIFLSILLQTLRGQPTIKWTKKLVYIWSNKINCALLH